MEKPSTTHSKRCNNQLWLVVLASFLLCLVLLCFDFSALPEQRNGITPAIGSHYQNPTVLTQKPETLAQKGNAEEVEKEKVIADSCWGKYVYIQEIPARFNQELLDNCGSVTPGTEHNMCPYLVNDGLGPSIEDSTGVLSNGSGSWYLTNQFILEVIFHNRMKNYSCLTNDSSLASAIYIPYYAGLDLSRFLWGYGATVRDQSGFELLKLLVEKPEWKRMWGRDHFMVAGRISWDFRRKTDEESDWGSKLRFLPESDNMSMLAIESSSWNNDYAIPYPTCFHPLNQNGLSEWQEKLRRQKRDYLFSFAGAPRSDLNASLRGRIFEECQGSNNLCKLLECSYGEKGAITCNNPVNVMTVFENSVFCLQPPGDSYTRRSTFDAILAGCIPVFFHPGTAYAQYKWHLPDDFMRYSVFIPLEHVEEWRAGVVNQTLLQIPAEKVVAMREQVIRLIPRVIYADSRSESGPGFEDAFDLAVKGILERIERVRKDVREGKDPAIGFAEGDDFKYTFSKYVDKSKILNEDPPVSSVD
ncbi:unnamed protein product [Linum tenue]|uniref:Exostosin GT47 domain-containing protein n=5 Tax=Linum tenue TaxID=586396 RepID=A0AAV0N3M6_9ROSI|nr:unnamed protein product [Linum tenue]